MANVKENYALTSDSLQVAVPKFDRECKQTFEIAENIRNADDFTVWATLVNDERFTVITAGNCGFSTIDLKPQYISLLRQLNLCDIYGGDNYIKIVRNADVIGSNADGSCSATANIGHNQQTVPCTVG